MDHCRVQDVAAVDSGPAFKSSHFGDRGEGIPLLRGDNIEPGALRWTRTKTWPDVLLAGYEHLFVESGDLVLGMDRPVVAAGLKLAQVRFTDLPALLVQRVARIRPKDIDGRYLYHWLSSDSFVRHLQGSATGTQLPHVTLASIRSFHVPRFGHTEERRIVDLLEDHLSRLDAAAAGLASSRKRLVALERSALDAHFGTDPEVPLSELIEDISAGKSFGASNSPALEDEWGIIKVSAMTWGEFKPQENKAVPEDRIDRRFEIREGDLLVSRANTAEYVGASVLVGPVRRKLLLSDKSLRITPNAEVLPEWLWRALQAPAARRQISALATGTKDSMRNISQTALRQVRLPKADLTMQIKALEAHEDVDRASRRMCTEIATAESRCNHLRRSVLTAAFSGRLTSHTSEIDQLEEAFA